MKRLLVTILTLTISGYAYASSGIGDTLYRYIKEELFSTATSESIGFFKSLNNVIKKNEVRFAHSRDGVDIKFVETGQYNLGVYFPRIGSMYLNYLDEVRLPVRNFALTFKDKKGNGYPYRFVNLPKVDIPVSLIARPAVTDRQRRRKEFPLNIYTYPLDATIKIMNIGPKYRDGMILENGRYDILIKRKGYKTFRQKKYLSWKEPNLYIAL